jgi:hypothetical protein
MGLIGRLIELPERGPSRLPARVNLSRWTLDSGECCLDRHATGFHRVLAYGSHAHA